MYVYDGNISSLGNIRLILSLTKIGVFTVNLIEYDVIAPFVMLSILAEIS
jgi:hypothetical protein